MSSFAWILKYFIPSWNFFSDFQETLELEVCSSLDGKTFSEWKTLRESPSPRQLSHLFFNPHENLDLAFQSLMESVFDEAQGIQKGQDASDFVKNLLSYQRLLRRVENFLLSEDAKPSSTSTKNEIIFQIRILLKQEFSASQETHKSPLLTSPIYRFTHSTQDKPTL